MTEERYGGELYWVMADAHLSEVDRDTSSLFTDFLDRFEREGPRKLVLLGDPFSSWIAIDSILSGYEKEILKRLYSLRMEGKELSFVPGNRDYFAESLGFRPFNFTGEVLRCNLPSGRTIQFEHGDRINLDDRKYLAWRSISRTGAVKALVRALPARAAEKVRMKLESRLAETNLDYRIDLPLEHLEKYAAELREEGVDMLVLGHFHKDLRLALAGVDIRILPRFAPSGSFCRVTGDEEIRIEKMLGS